MPSTRSTTSRRPGGTLSESQIQRAVFQHLRQRGTPGVFAFHPANGGFRKPVEAAIFKGLGVVPGVPDVIVIKKGWCYALELKSEKGKISPKQEEALAALEAAGAVCGVAYGLDHALTRLAQWGLLRGGTNDESHAGERVV
jgi:hypothetical protein